MAHVLPAEQISRQGPRKQSAVVVLTALGVVYGDIGTSTLYGLKQAVDAGGGPAPETVMGIVSLIFWALLLIVGLKYAILILRADNHGEGGIVALLALLDARHAPRGSARASLLIVGLIGAALLYGDGVITPAISVLSAVEGLKIDAPALAPMVVPITIAILVGLFLVQRKGTEFVGNIFGPVMLVWFIAIAVLGLGGIVQSPSILVAVSPHHAVLYLTTRDPVSPSPYSVPPFWRSPARRPCMPIWAISAGCPSSSDGSRSSCLPCCSTIWAREGYFSPIPKRPRIRSTCLRQDGRITQWWRSQRSPPSSLHNRSSRAPIPSPSRRCS